MGVKFGALCYKKNILRVCESKQGGEENIWCERELRIEGCRRFCSELHVCYSSPHIVYIIVARKINTYVACNLHILKKK